MPKMPIYPVLSGEVKDDNYFIKTLAHFKL
jgi:hypothetical protein